MLAANLNSPVRTRLRERYRGAPPEGGPGGVN